ncbi:MAG: lysylphosphatidylglycerol synthase transmembrane domain-containing protein [Croceibacterium sp.]
MAETARLQESRSHGWRTAPFAAVVLAGLVAVVLHLSDLERFAEMARRAEPFWLLAGFAFQFATYAFLALGWQAVLRRAGSPQLLRRLLPIALCKLFVDQVVPAAGMGGNVLLVDRLRALGAPRGTAVSTLLVSILGYYAAYAALALAMMVALWLHHAATALVVGPVTAFLLVTLAIPSLYLWTWKRGARPLPRLLERFPPLARLLATVSQAPPELVGDRPLIARVAMWNGLIVVADAATLAVCLHALGGPLLPLTAFIAVMAAAIAVTLAPLPMGLGSFEATCTATLAMLGVPVAAALAATLLLRMLTLWLPLLPGLWLMRRAGHRGRKRQ